jgi:DNA-binding protein YbaB
MKKTCKQCGIEYNARANSFYCSIKCKQKKYRISEEKALLHDLEYLNQYILKAQPQGNSVIEHRIKDLQKKLEQQ